MSKKYLSVLLIFALIFTLVSCNRENRINFSELLKRMNESMKTEELSMEDAFFSDGEWFLFIQKDGEDRFIISAKENGESKFIDSVSVSVINKTDENLEEDYREYCVALAQAFIFDIDTNEALTSLGLFTEGMLFSDNTTFYEKGRFSLSWFNAELGSTLLIEIIR